MGTSHVTHGLVLKEGEFTSFDFPGVTFTDAPGINPGGVIVGLFEDSWGNFHGFFSDAASKQSWPQGLTLSGWPLVETLFCIGLRPSWFAIFDTKASNRLMCICLFEVCGEKAKPRHQGARWQERKSCQTETYCRP
jgi:hypothetical protein